MSSIAYDGVVHTCPVAESPSLPLTVGAIEALDEYEAKYMQTSGSAAVRTKTRWAW